MDQLQGMRQVLTGFKQQLESLKEPIIVADNMMLRSLDDHNQLLNNAIDVDAIRYFPSHYLLCPHDPMLADVPLHLFNINSQTYADLLSKDCAIYRTTDCLRVRSHLSRLCGFGLRVRI